MNKVKAAFPQAKWHTYEPASRDGARLGAQMAFGQPVNTVYQFDKADVVLSLDADFLTSGPGSVRYARDFISRRRLTGGSKEMNRLYVAESTLTATGAKADHRLPIRASEVEAFALAVASAVGVTGLPQAKLSGRGREIRRGRGQRPQGAQRQEHRHRRRTSISVSPRHRARDQRRSGRAGRDALLHRSARDQSGRSDRLDHRSGRRFERGQGRIAGDHRRQSGLQRADLRAAARNSSTR